MRVKSKRYRKEADGLSKEPLGLSAAIEKIKSFNSVKFDQTVECVLKLGINPKQADQLIRGSISLPHGTGKQNRVVAFCDDADVEAAKKAGAIEAGSDELVGKVTDGWTDFDVAVASPKVMGKVGKLGRVLGPQGKMPSPKNGTITEDIPKAVAEFAAGKIEYRNDSGGNVHVVVGRQSFDKKKLAENIQALISHMKKIRPVTTKGTYIKGVFLTATMSPSVPVSV